MRGGAVAHGSPAVPRRSRLGRNSQAGGLPPPGSIPTTSNRTCAALHQCRRRPQPSVVRNQSRLAPRADGVTMRPALRRSRHRLPSSRNDTWTGVRQRGRGAHAPSIGQPEGKPIARDRRHLLERTRLLEEMCRTRDDDQLRFPLQGGDRRAVVFENLCVVTAYEQQCGRMDESERRSGEIRPSSSRYSPGTNTGTGRIVVAVAATAPTPLSTVTWKRASICRAKRGKKVRESRTAGQLSASRLSGIHPSITRGVPDSAGSLATRA